MNIKPAATHINTESAALEAGLNFVQIWENIRADFKVVFDEDTYNRWLSKIELHSFSSVEIIMSVPSKFLRDWIRREYIENNSTKSNIREICLKYSPNLKKISIIHIEKAVENIVPTSKSNVVSISKHDNVFTFGIELNPKFTFENFIVGSCNKLACGIAKVIAKIDESLFNQRDVNPLFLYGGVGLGKTHLSQAIAWHIKENDKNSKVVYISAERFMDQFVKSLRNQNILDFKDKFRAIDVLIIDDLQFLSGKDGTQEELLNTLNNLIENNKKIVLVCDRSPGDLNDISAKFKSKIASGFIADFKCPDYETRLKILQSQAAQFDFEIKNEILELIANKINSNVRDLEGALKKLTANHMITGEEISVKNTKELLKDLFRTNHNETTIEKIQKTVAQHFEIKISDLKSNSRLREFARPRQIAMYLCKNFTDKNLPEIGREFGGKNHATVIHAIKTIEKFCENDSKIAAILKNLEEKISN